MGWWFTSPTKEALVEERNRAEQWKDGNGVSHSLTIIAHKVVGSILWQVVEHKKGEEAKRYIVCNLMKAVDGRWGYKDISESAHPFYYSCPPEFLPMVPVACAEWRAKVLNFHWMGGTVEAVY